MNTSNIDVSSFLVIFFSKFTRQKYFLKE